MSLPKPIGAVIEDAPKGGVYVADLMEGGSAFITKKLRKSGRPTLTFEPWRRGVLVRLVEMLAWRAAGVTDTGSSVADDGSLSA